MSAGAMTLDELARSIRWLGLQDVTLKRVKLPDGTYEFHATASQPHTDKTIGSFSDTLPTAIVALINAASPKEE